MTGKFPKRGEIYLTDLEPTKGGETQKRRPCLIVSNDIGNEISRVVMAAPITSKTAKIYPFEVKTIVQNKPAKIMLNQCRAIDKSRILKPMGQVDAETMHAVEDAIKIVFGLT
ncbi:MAG: type II toxin-antitoxin system PemK/MazF family toxin [Verrucomicrobia bacterium]|nr:type II toxin-antitoxin system PemK/MazF family toxin [Verrucomicrobiota bacterium]